MWRPVDNCFLIVYNYLQLVNKKMGCGYFVSYAQFVDILCITLVLFYTFPKFERKSGLFMHSFHKFTLFILFYSPQSTALWIVLSAMHCSTCAYVNTFESQRPGVKYDT